MGVYVSTVACRLVLLIIPLTDKHDGYSLKAWRPWAKVEPLLAERLVFFCRARRRGCNEGDVTLFSMFFPSIIALHRCALPTAAGDNEYGLAPLRYKGGNAFLRWRHRAIRPAPTPYNPRPLLLRWRFWRRMAPGSRTLVIPPDHGRRLVVFAGKRRRRWRRERAAASLRAETRAALRPSCARRLQRRAVAASSHAMKWWRYDGAS